MEMVKEKPAPVMPLRVRTLGVVAVVAGVGMLVVCALHVRLPSPRPAHSAPPDTFVAERAYQHLLDLTSIGPRVAGSYENEVLAVRCVVSALRQLTEHAAPHHRIDVDVHVADGAFPIAFLDGMNNVYRGVRSVVARVSARGARRRRTRTALLFNCHIDTVPDSPGASDDGAGCAVLLETLRALAVSSRLLAHDAIFLFNGAEENIMQGSHAFITQHEWAGSVRAFLNIEACGAGGREVLFQAGPKDPWIVETYAARAPHPYGSSIAQEIFESGLIPADTDFRIFRDFGNLSGVDLAWSSNGYVYHTGLDTAERVPPAALQRTGDNVLALALGLLLRPELEREPGPEPQLVFFDVMGLTVARADPARTAALGVLAALAVLVRLRFGAVATKYLRSTSFTRAVLTEAGRGLLAGALGVGWCAGTAGVLGALGASMAWYGRPALLVPLYCAPAAGVAGLAALGLRGGERMRGGEAGWARGEAAAGGLLAVWAALGVLAAVLGVRSGAVCLLWSVPGAAAHIAAHLAGGRGRVWWWAAGAAPGLLQTWYLAVGSLHMFVPIMGRVGSDLPTEVVMATLVSVLFLTAVNWLLPLVLVTHEPRPALRALVALGLATAALAASTPLGFPYTPSAPQRFMVFHTRRTTHPPLDRPPAVGYWIPELDRHTPHTLDGHVAGVSQAVPTSEAECAELLYCGAPYYLPVLSFIRRSHWVPARSEPLARVSASVRAEVVDGTSTRLHVTVQGPAHAVVILSPTEGVRLRALDLLPGPPQEGPRWGRRRTYFVSLHHSRDRPAAWSFTADLQHSLDPAPSHWADVSVAGHCLFGDHKTDPTTRAWLETFPQWTAVTSWSVDLHLYRV